MSTIKHQVFVSSTYLDLREERQAAVEAILRAGHIPAGMELFTADNRSQLDVITSWIDESDIFVVILGTRYGSIEPSTKRSYTEYEYRYAIDKGKPTLGLILSDNALEQKYKKLKSKAADSPEDLKEFRKFVTTKMVKIVDNTDQIKLAIFEGIQTIQKTNNLSGWIKSDSSARMVAAEIAKLTAENTRLRKGGSDSTSSTDDADVQKWISTLQAMNGISFAEYQKRKADPSYVVPKSHKYTLLHALIDHASLLATGVTDSATSASDYSVWIYGIAGELLSMGLAEFDKVPSNVAWKRICLSSEGKKVIAAIHHRAAIRDKGNADSK